MTRSILALSIVFSLAWRSGLAQCPNGAPPPCGPPRPAPDPNVIAILPFRVSGADPSLAYLRDGMVELLTAEFTGDGAPRAVEPGTMFRAWKRAGGNRAHLDQAAALRLARELGAGQLLMGAVVGSQSRVTVTASIVGVPNGDARVPTVRVEGVPDSPGAMLGELSARLLTRGTGAWRLTDHDPGTTSSEALRAFFAGRAAYREGRFRESVEGLSRALDLDSSFVLAAYWLCITNGWGPEVPDRDRVTQLAWGQRRRLGAERQLLLEALFGPGGPTGSDDRAVTFAARERAATTLRGSAEAWYLLGDFYFHQGALGGYEDWIVRSRAALQRSLALDTTFGVLEHLAYLAFIEGHTAEHARLVGLMARHTEAGTPELLEQRYLAAVASGSPRVIRAAREGWVRGLEVPPFALRSAQLLAVPQHEADSLLLQIEAHATTEPQRHAIDEARIWTWSNAGRPALAAEARRRWFGGETLGLDSLDLDMLIWGEHDSAAAERLDAALRATPDRRDAWYMRCHVALSRLRRADTTNLAATLQQLRATGRPRALVCVEVLEAVVGSWRGSAAKVALVRVDSMLRSVYLFSGSVWNYDIALAFARIGEWRAAAAAARRRLFLSGENWRMAIALRDEGRWSAMAGDTANAIRAFRHYLALREDPEPVMIPERDSIRAELLRIGGRLP